MDFLRKLILHHQLRFEEGKVTFGNERLLLGFVPQFIEDEYLETLLDPLHPYIRYLAGYNIGRFFVETKGAPLGKLLPEVIDISEQILSSFGWGKFKVIKFTENKFALLHADSSTYADEIKARYGPREEPLDYMFSGIFAGFVSFYYKGNVLGFETHCRVQRDKQICVFAAGDKQLVLDYLEKEEPAQRKRAEEFWHKLQEVREMINFFSSHTVSKQQNSDRSATPRFFSSCHPRSHPTPQK